MCCYHLRLGTVLTTDRQFLMMFYEAVGRYVKAIDDWERCFRDVASDPNFWGQVRDPAALKMHQRDFIDARNEINRMIRRASEIVEQRGHSSPFGILFRVTLRPPENSFLPCPSALSDDARMLIHDVIMQTVADIETGYLPKQSSSDSASVPRFAKLKAHLEEHLPKYIVALIAVSVGLLPFW